MHGLGQAGMLASSDHVADDVGCGWLLHYISYLSNVPDPCLEQWMEDAACVERCKSQERIHDEHASM